MKIILASSNEHKVKEINAIVSSFPLLDERAGVRGQNSTEPIIEFVLPPTGFDPIEDGNTFEENSLIKAKEAWKLGKTWTLADDSGLCIDALNGAPGIHSARYAETPQARIDKVLKEMQGVKNRFARFKCCMTLLNPDGEVAFSYTGVSEGSIVEHQRGVNGFGYDPIFLVKGADKTMAELSEDEKNEISHRGRALKEVIKYLKTV
jgi:XTP/dITP diphosphohydrolase